MSAPAGYERSSDTDRKAGAPTGATVGATGPAQPDDERSSTTERMAGAPTGATADRTTDPTFVDSLRANARTHPDKEALVHGDERVTWGAFDRAASRIANALIARGVGPGDRVAILSSNTARLVEIMAGTLRAGACMVPLSTMAAPDVLARMVADSGARTLFLTDEWRALAAEVAVDTRIAIDFEADGWMPFADMLGDDTDPHVPVAERDLFAILYSSGTTGVPKGVVHDHLFRMRQNERMRASGIHEDARALVSTPLYSHATLTAAVPTLAFGGTLVIMSRWDARESLALMERERVTHAMMVPVQYKRLMDVADVESFDLASLEHKYCTSAPLREAVLRDVLARLPGAMIEFYGATEGGATTVLRAHEHPDKLHTVGKPGPGVELRFIDEADREVPARETGEVVGRSPAMMLGYHGNQAATLAATWTAPDGERFVRSGDVGRLDEDGFLILSDRRKDMIISGGLNLYADDLERVLLQHPAVDDCAVIAVPSEEWGETPLALVVAREKAAADELRDWANERLGRSQRLSAVELRESLPRSPIGKILKRELREPYWVGRERAIN